jgi:hypothetical protein
MTDLTASQWRTIEKESIYLPSQSALGRFIALGTLRTILRRRRTNDQNALLWALYSDALKLGGEALGGWTTDDIARRVSRLGPFRGIRPCSHEAEEAQLEAHETGVQRLR